MPTQPAPQPSAPKPAAKPSERSVEVPPPDPGSAAPKPDEEGAVFRAFLDAGAGAVVAYTAEKQLHTMLSEAVAPQLEAFRLEVYRRFDQQDRRFDQQDRRFDQQDRKLDDLAAAGAERDRRLDEHDRKLDVILARLDGLKLLGQIMIGAYALLITALIAVFGFLFTN